jgi:hypothetical protein
MSDSEEQSGGFLRGWSRRKIEAKRQEAEPEASLPVEEAATPEAEEIDPDLIAALPSIEDITAEFDIKPFLAKGVPAHLKNAALRRLWSISPSVRDYSDPAVDYAWDWNAPGGVPGGGGILSEKSVAKMVKDLIGNRPDPDEAPEINDIDTDLAEHAAEISTDVVEEVAPEPAPVRLSAVEEKPARTPERPEVRRESATLPAPPRRHGGAAPE